MQSVILPASEVEPLVDGFRQAGDWSRRLGVPAHITLAGPWPLEVELPVPALASIAVAMRGIVFRLSRIDLLGDALCLLADDDAPLLKLRAAVLAAIGVSDELDEQWRPHLTVFRHARPHDRRDICEAIGPQLPVDCEAASLRIARLVAPDRVDILTV
jgi:hypothetical protein